MIPRFTPEEIAIHDAAARAAMNTGWPTRAAARRSLAEFTKALADRHTLVRSASGRWYRVLGKAKA